MRLALLLLLAAAGLQGCASMEWVRPGTTPEQANLDAQQCRNAAWLNVNSYGWPSPWYPWYPRYPAWRGYWAAPWGPDPFFEESRLADFCMRVRGYQLVEKPKPAEQTQSPGSASSGRSVRE